MYKVFIIIGISLLLLTPSCVSRKKNYTQIGLNLYEKKSKFRGIVKLKTVEGQFFCTATIISKTEALSSAHCFFHLPSNDFVVQSLPNDKDQIVVTLSYVAGINKRSDTAIIRGDFSDFDKFSIDTSPDSDILINDYNLIACGFPYGGDLVCYKFSDPYKMFDFVAGVGQMYAGMSGGPVINLDNGKILAVNHAVGEGYVVISPIVNLFQSLIRVQ